MAPVARQIGDVAVRTLLHHIGGAVSVDVTLLLLAAANQVTAGNTHVRQLTDALAVAKRGLTVMQADATRLQRRVAQYETEVAQWQARAEQALRAGDAPLARQALARKLQVERVVAQYAEAQTAQQRSLNHIHAAVVQLEARINNVQAGRGPAALLAARDHQTVEARFAQFELDQAMDALRRTVQR